MVVYDKSIEQDLTPPLSPIAATHLDHSGVSTIRNEQQRDSSLLKHKMNATGNYWLRMNQ